MSSIARQILDEIRGEKTEWTPHRLADRLGTAGPKPTAKELWTLCSQLQEKQEGAPANNPNDPFNLFRQMFSDTSLFDTFSTGRGSATALPSIVVDFAAEYLKSARPKRLLNPWCEDPPSLTQLLATVPTLQHAEGIVDSELLRWRAELFGILSAKVLDWKKSVEWKLALDTRASRTTQRGFFRISASFGPDALKAIAETSPDWDVILCYPPMGGVNTKHEPSAVGTRPAFTIKDNEGSLVVFESALKLAPTGVGLFVVPPIFFSPGRQNSVSVYAALERVGLAAEAFLSIPPEHRGQIPGVDVGLLIVRKGAQGPLFAGELQADPDRRKLLIENLARKREGKEFALGMLADKKQFRSYAALKTGRDYQTQLARQGLPVVNLADLLEESNGPKRNQESAFAEKANAIYLPGIGFSPVVTSTEQFGLKPQNYLQLVLKADLVNADFFANFLNSELGLLARRSLLSGNFIAKVSLDAVRKGVQVPVPPLSVQTAVMEVNTALRDLATDVENLRKQLWGRPSQVEKLRRAVEQINRKESFEDWLQTLPFPLASILWNYHTAGHEPKEQFELLLKFFEGVAEFIAAILLSAARRDAAVWNEVRTYLIKERERIESSTFGTWTELIAFTSIPLRRLWSEVVSTRSVSEPPGRARCEAALGTSRSEVIQAILSKQLLAVLQTANQFRNDYGGHYGILGEETAANLLVQLRSFLSEVRSSFGQAWESYQLLLPTNRSEWTGQHHEVVVNLLQGINTPFLKETRKLSEPLKRNTLYLLDKDQDRAVELLPLVKISSGPKEAANACYFYNRKQPDGARYVSYHFEKEADRTFPNAEVEQLFRELFGS